LSVGINIQKLSEGIHEVNEEISEEDLSLPENIKFPNNLQVNVIIDKFEHTFRLKVRVRADIVEQCDRCLSEFSSKFEETIEQLYQLGTNEFESDEIEVIPDSSKEIDISDLIADAFLVNRSIQRICKEDCSGLCPVCGKNLNKEQCNCNNEKIDPRLEKLKSLLK